MLWNGDRLAIIEIYGGSTKVGPFRVNVLPMAFRSARHGASRPRLSEGLVVRQFSTT